MSEQNRQLLERTYEAFGQGDIATVMAAFDEHIDWSSPELLPHGMHVKGRDAVGGFFEKLASEWDPGFGIEIDAIFASGDRACAIGRAAGHLDGVAASYGFVHAWTIRDGACVRFDEYVDPSAELITRAAAQTV